MIPVCQDIRNHSVHSVTIFEILRHNNVLIAAIIDVCHHTPIPFLNKVDQEVPFLHSIAL